MTLYIFFFLSFIAIFFGLMTVLSKNPIHSLLYLILCFVAIACHFLFLNAQFLFIVHLIVYAGAIMVLFLSTLMLMNLNEETEQHKSALAKISAAIASIVLMLVLVFVLKKADTLPVPMMQDISIGDITNLGKVLLDEYLFPFEFASVLFLSAMIGAVLLTKKDKAKETQ